MPRLVNYYCSPPPPHSNDCCHGNRSHVHKLIELKGGGCVLFSVTVLCSDVMVPVLWLLLLSNSYLVCVCVCVCVRVCVCVCVQSQLNYSSIFTVFSLLCVPSTSSYLQTNQCIYKIIIQSCMCWWMSLYMYMYNLYTLNRFLNVIYKNIYFYNQKKVPFWLLLPH